MELTEDELAASDQFRRYRLIQSAPDRLEVVYEARIGATADETARVLSVFEQRLAAAFDTTIDFTHRVVEQLDETPRVKRKVVVNAMEPRK